MPEKRESNGDQPPPKRQKLDVRVKQEEKGDGKKVKKEKDDSRERKPWTTAEEAAFDRVVNSIVRTHLWAAAKNEPILAKRGNSSVRSHWEAKFGKMKGE